MRISFVLILLLLAATTFGMDTDTQAKVMKLVEGMMSQPEGKMSREAARDFLLQLLHSNSSRTNHDLAIWSGAEKGWKTEKMDETRLAAEKLINTYADRLNDTMTNAGFLMQLKEGGLVEQLRNLESKLEKKSDL